MTIPIPEPGDLSPLDALQKPDDLTDLPRIISDLTEIFELSTKPVEGETWHVTLDGSDIINGDGEGERDEDGEEGEPDWEWLGSMAATEDADFVVHAHLYMPEILYYLELFRRFLIDRAKALWVDAIQDWYEFDYDDDTEPISAQLILGISFMRHAGVSNQAIYTHWSLVQIEQGIEFPENGVDFSGEEYEDVRHLAQLFASAMKTMRKYPSGKMPLV